jgi:predicted RNA-binding Zn-ribbon protein involved in translation (DUF1610 family)
MDRYTFTLSRQHKSPADWTCGNTDCDEAVPHDQPVPLRCPGCGKSEFHRAPYAEAVRRAA